MYKVIDKELNIASCRLSDLTVKQVNAMLNQWEPGAGFGSLTLFIEPEKNIVILNEDHEYFDLNKELATSYLKANSEQRKEIAKNIPKSLAENVKVLDKFIAKKGITAEINEEIRKVLYGSICSFDFLVIIEIGKRFGGDSALRMAYTYGMIQGKRVERAKKKRGR